MTSFLIQPASPAPERAAASPPAASAADGARRIERSLDERARPPELDPVLREIARVAAELAAQPLVRDDATALHIIDRMAEAGDMERLEALAEALRRHLAARDANAPSRVARAAPSRLLLKL